MQSAIFKYALQWIPEQKLEIPRNSEFLCLAIQNKRPTIWYKHNPIIDDWRPVTIIMRPTGISDDLFAGEDYITTLFTENDLVWHFFFKH